jgi:hypothetical protein
VTLLCDKANHIAPEILGARAGLDLDILIFLERNPIACKALELFVRKDQNMTMIVSHQSRAPRSAMEPLPVYHCSAEDVVGVLQVKL